MKKLAAILALACSAAGATDINKSTDIVLDKVSDMLMTTFVATFGPESVGKTFSYKFNFSLPDSVWFNAQIAEDCCFGPKNINITSVNLFKGDHLASNGILMDGDIGVGVPNFWQIIGAPTAGAYSFDVEGNIASTGSFGGSIDVVPTPIPEPNIWAMMLAGISALGVAARKKNLIQG